MYLRIYTSRTERAKMAHHVEIQLPVREEHQLSLSQYVALIRARSQATSPRATCSSSQVYTERNRRSVVHPSAANSRYAGDLRAGRTCCRRTRSYQRTLYISANL